MKADSLPRFDSSPDALALLTRTERLAFRLGDAMSRHWPGASRVWSVLMCPLLWLAFGRRIRVEGLEHLEAVGRLDRLVLAANHRSFFDFYVTALVIRWWARMPNRFLFPVRAPFVYDHPVGVAVNFLASGMSMFPPIFRGERGPRLNEVSVARCIAELARPGTIVGLHPEGTRNRDRDPASLLPPRRGLGRLALGVPEARVVPVFVAGLSDRIGRELRHTWWAAEGHPVVVRFGPEMDLADLRAPEGAGRGEAERAVTERWRDAILALARTDASPG